MQLGLITLHSATNLPIPQPLSKAPEELGELGPWMQAKADVPL